MTATSTASDRKTLEAICKELDQLALSYLYKLNQYTQFRTVTTEELQKGYLDLAHAKYTMGAHISHFSYDERMKAHVQLKVDNNNKAPYTLIKKPAMEPSRLQHRKESEWMQKDPDDVAEKDEYEMDEKKPLKRLNKVIKPIGNPLHWFGLLVSPSLRTSQDHFQTATTHLIDMANMIHDLEATERQYLELKEEKDAMIQQRMNNDTLTAVTALLESTTAAD